MTRDMRKRIMRNIIQHADQMVVIYANGKTCLLSSLPLRTVLRLMCGMLHPDAVHAVVGRPRRAYTAPAVESFPVIHAHGVQ